MQECENLGESDCTTAPQGHSQPPVFSRGRPLAGVTLIETLISLMIIVIGLAGLFGTSGQCMRFLRRSKELVGAREDLLCRLDTLRTLSYAQVAKSSYLSTSILVTGTAGDPSPFTSTDDMKSFTETITVYALGSQVFSSDDQRNNATPDSSGEFASELNTVEPTSAPKTYKSNSLVMGDWTLQVANALYYFQITRTGTGANATTSVVHADNNGDLTGQQQVLVNISYSWVDASNNSHTQVGSMIISRSGSLQ